ncbi:MAG: cell division protein FtsH [Candidatus Harrisonbacteria bacterium RIFCSPLOWO2_02_FULL_41_13b]|uniref:ATP-dependent zinc metalloprotease FtsH n=1 Tax=Candidatus Harrisonbacteria bacterium RIFCSPLOWO2_02_FULL_41_13b TaxID=1798409 RepID=A0A1G1ZR65_9BACT|nr:MAG: cell division protein FtsH [Candidatus Yanofskybacteria bacterium RIFCSPLOWO2_01_FULL_41_34]OGY63481.1 MAG: cell division protein FtsH [Candidatus Harrisonbacteria bacterium RIFCSPHIGHO2_02_FULL_40_20]OGY66945.1 MAG: cell division protein FtsH [Candidatus Harrisonbacteria bacterium RIFCSPLOWO2_02_FULL_41_13b]
MKLITLNLFWAVITFIVLAVIFSFFLNTGPKPEALTINDLVSRINAGEVTKVVVSGNDLKVTLSGDKAAIAKKESESSFSDTLANLGVDKVALQKIALEIKDESGFQFWMGILLPTILPLLVIGFFFWIIFRQAKGGASQAFTFGRANIRLFAHSKDKTTFKDVAGLREAKQELEEVVDFLKNPKKFLEIGARIPRGVLLMGSPGTGKTLLARAVAGEAKVPFFHISASEFVEMFVGVGASRTRDAFATAKKAAPAILFIDEIDAVGRERGAGVGGGHDEREQTLNQILVEMDGFERDTRLIVLAATNRPDVLDSALLRPGRFDRRVVLDMPDIKDREEILKIHSRGKALDKDIDLRKIAVRTPGFSGADLANVLNEAAILAARNNSKIIKQDNIYDSIEKVMLGPERRGRVISDKEKEIVAYHEAGHALVAAGLKDADPVHKVSIISRGQAGGYTLKLPIEEVRLHTSSQFLADLATAMGGYVAEKEMFGDITTGASNDIKVASDLARKMVTRFGMSEKLGPMTFGESHEMVFLGKEISQGRNYSEKVAADIDKEVTGFINRAFAAAKKIINTNKKALDAIAKTLIEKEILEQEDFYNILKPFNLKPSGI